MMPGARLDGQILPRSGFAGPMLWIVAVMMMLATLAGAASLGLSAIAGALGSGNAVMVQIVTADADRREAEAGAALSLLRASPSLRNVRRVPDAEIAGTLAPWLGSLESADIPIPAIIEGERVDAADLRLVATSLAAQAPAARLTTSEAWLAPLARLVAALRWMAGATLILALAAGAAVVALSARAALAAHRQVVDLLHLIGATDRQIAGLVQKRIGTDIMWGSSLGAGIALLLILLLRERIAAVGSGLLGPALDFAPGWPALVILPFAATALAMLVARITLLRALKAVQ